MTGFFPLSQVQVNKPDLGLTPKCGSCGLYKSCNSPKMKPHGEGAKGVLIVGEAPGQTEDEKGRPFVGKAGKKLRQSLDTIGVDLDEDCVTTNALICRPPGNKIPDPKMIGYCRPNILKVIEEVKPRIILTLGRHALASVLKPFWKESIDTMDKWVGWRIPIEKHWICPTWHPSYLLRQDNHLMDRIFESHLEQAFELGDPPPQPKFRDQIELLYEEDRIAESLRAIDREGGWTAFDYETNCLKPEYPKARIFSCGISNGRRTIAYPWHGRAIRLTSEFLRSKRTRKIASNIKMEERWTLKFLGHPIRNLDWDTMLAAHAMDNREGICSLKFQALIHLGVPSYNENVEPYLEGFHGHYNRIEEIELKTLLFYNGMDGITEHMVGMKQREEMGYDE